MQTPSLVADRVSNVMQPTGNAFAALLQLHAQCLDGTKGCAGIAEPQPFEGARNAYQAIDQAIDDIHLEAVLVDQLVIVAQQGFAEQGGERLDHRSLSL